MLLYIAARDNIECQQGLDSSVEFLRVSRNEWVFFVAGNNTALQHGSDLLQVVRRHVTRQEIALFVLAEVELLTTFFL